MSGPLALSKAPKVMADALTVHAMEKHIRFIRETRFITQRIHHIQDLPATDQLRNSSTTCYQHAGKTFKGCPVPPFHQPHL